jgi:hypothetical protein
MKTTFKTARKYGSQVLAVGTGLMLSGAAMAQTAGPFDAIFDAIDLAGITTKVVAAAIVVVSIALAFKGPDIGKRVIRKV